MSDAQSLAKDLSDRARIAALEAALLPFARYGAYMAARWGYHDRSAFYGVKRRDAPQIRYGDFRRAVSVMSNKVESEMANVIFIIDEKNANNFTQSVEVWIEGQFVGEITPGKDHDIMIATRYFGSINKAHIDQGVDVLTIGFDLPPVREPR